MQRAFPTACLLATLATAAPAQDAGPAPLPPAPVQAAPAPADLVDQAARAWDGDGCTPAPEEAHRLLGLAIDGYKAMAAGHPQDIELADYVVHLEKVGRLMERFAGFDAGKDLPPDTDLPGFSPSYLALELLALPDTDATGLRRRLACVQAHLERNREACLLSQLAAPDLRYMGIRTARLGSKDYLGLTSWVTDATSFTANMEFYMDNMPPTGQDGEDAATRLSKELHRAVIVNDTLAHELTHVYFCSRYPKISSSTADDIRRVYEGHAISTAYIFVRDVYFRGKLTPEQYAAIMLSPRYKRYFLWYRSNVLTPEGGVRWGLLDAFDLRTATNGYYVRTRVPMKSLGAKAPALRYFGNH